MDRRNQILVLRDPRKEDAGIARESDADGGRCDGAAPKLLSGAAAIVSVSRDPRDGRTHARSSGRPSRRAAVTYMFRALAPGASTVRAPATVAFVGVRMLRRYRRSQRELTTGLPPDVTTELTGDLPSA